MSQNCFEYVDIQATLSYPGIVFIVLKRFITKRNDYHIEPEKANLISDIRDQAVPNFHMKLHIIVPDKKLRSQNEVLCRDLTLSLSPGRVKGQSRVIFIWSPTQV